MIKNTVEKIGYRVNMVNSYRINGRTSLKLKQALFSCYVLPIFTWLFGIFPCAQKTPFIIPVLNTYIEVFNEHNHSSHLP
jgi:hypothetical protein